MRESIANMGLTTANSVKKDIWMNIERASGQMITIDRRYLSKLLSDLEKSQYSKGYSDGYRHRDLIANKELPTDLDFEGHLEEW